MIWKRSYLSSSPLSVESLYSLAFFRIVFGAIMTIAELRFISKGWIDDFYIQPDFFFTFYGFEWITPPSAPYVYWVFYAMVGLAVCITLGFFYRFAIIAFFVLFTWVELWDKSVYLNHYYQISLLSLLMCFLPMHAIASVDAYFRKQALVVRSWIAHPENLLRLQVGFVYFFGGVAKLKYDWLFLAQPLKIWLAANEDFPIVGPLLTQTWVAYTISWLAMIFDLSALFLLFNKRTRLPIYIVIVIFHLLTHFLFHIGMFPWIMIGTALIFFPSTWHKSIVQRLRFTTSNPSILIKPFTLSNLVLVRIIIITFISVQLVLPFRHLFYPGNVLWHEQGFRFAWHIMLMEKNGSTTFYVKQKENGQEFTVRPDQFLTPIQARQMSFQPDMILQFAHYLHNYYLENGLGETEIRVEAYASVNGRGSALLIDPSVNLVDQKDSFSHKAWITNYE